MCHVDLLRWFAGRNCKFWQDVWTETRGDVRCCIFLAQNLFHQRRRKVKRRKSEVRLRRTIVDQRIDVHTVIADLQDVVRHQGSGLYSFVAVSTVCGNKKDPRKQILLIFGIVQYFFTKFSEIILNTICHYCCKFYRLKFCCLEVAQFEYKRRFFFNCADK